MILDVVCRTTGMGFAAVAHVTKDRWIACAVQDLIDFKLEAGGELDVATTICDEIRDSGEAVVIDHVAEDQAFCGHPTPAMYGFQSYISMPILRANGEFFGTLCAIDPQPRKLDTPETVGMFRLFADLIAFHLDATERLETSQSALLDAQATAELREQFIAVLGHDLRNPLASLEGGVRLLEKSPPEDKKAAVLTLMKSSLRRMAGLINNVMDLTRSRLGGGLVVRPSESLLRPVVAQVIDELRASHPDREIEARIALDRPVRCEPDKIAQLFSNLLGNALNHGAPDAPVRVRAGIEDGAFVLTVANSGKPIPEEARAALFQPFFRAPGRTDREGLGLGLYISAEIAHAHGGTLDVASDEAETRFTLTMPAG